MRHELLVGGLAAAAAIVLASPGDARACGGCFSPPMQNGDVVTDHRMIFAISQDQTTLYDEIEYQGSPQSFAWVLPIQGPVTVGLSADTLFSALDQATHVSIVAPPRTVCQSCNCGEALGGASSSGGGFGESPTAPPVTIISQAVVGPYATVQLKSSDPNALDAWLTANGYSVPGNVAPVIAAYVKEGFDFLALKLVPGQGVSAMRPVSVTSPGAGLSLPLRMVAAGTGATVGITLWVVADGRYEPKNFAQFVISPSDLIWDFNSSSSNYTTLQQQKETVLKNAAWQIESSLSLSPLAIENSVLQTSPGSPGDYAAIPGMDAGSSDGGSTAGESVDAVRRDDLATVFAGGPQNTQITRMRADLSQAALVNDLVLQASQDQSALSNVYQVTRSVNDTVCPPFDASKCNCSASNGDDTGFGGGTSEDDAGAEGGTPIDENPGRVRAGSSNCSVGPVGTGSSDIGVALAGLLGLALLRTRKKSR